MSLRWRILKMNFQDSIINMRIKMLEQQIERLDMEKREAEARQGIAECLLAYLSHAHFKGELVIDEESVLALSNIDYHVKHENGKVIILTKENPMH